MPIGTQPMQQWSNLRKRVVAAGILLPLTLLAFLFGPAWFVVLFLLMSCTLSVSEMAMMILPALDRKLAADPAPQIDPVTGNRLPQVYVFPAITVFLGWAVLITSVSGTAEVAVGSVAFSAFMALLIGVFSSKDIDVAAGRAFGILISLCYGALPWVIVWFLYRAGPNARYVLLLMAVTWCGDTGAYFGGRYYGGKIFGDRKLAPVISPKKTWEGAIAGVLASILGAHLLNLVFFNSLGPFSFITKLALVGGIAAQLGDLVESTFKRFSGVKDSGVLIPGHGGFLDRVDGILFAAPVIWAILYYFRGVPLTLPVP
jgi:phosphatidate cytidylyltransferase